MPSEMIFRERGSFLILPPRAAAFSRPAGLDFAAGAEVLLASPASDAIIHAAVACSIHFVGRRSA